MRVEKKAKQVLRFTGARVGSCPMSISGTVSVGFIIDLRWMELQRQWLDIDTVKRLQPAFADIEEIQRNGLFVGYQSHSFVKDFLIKQLNFTESKLKSYSIVPEKYDEALSKRIQNGGVAAIFNEIPYIKRFLAKY
ncbi:hypothetical protein GH714_016718 [Hevea brasiliensis]|uniref:Solute-binding protein family 3/N-terminal domain-containing protein n=1 Tax=Hevea brasiliensis TaxID=3981 RepID=A0A6A6K5S3_HEVBR|nr:hypothetical protein GH714_016718 [Hevea brasiliensis]